MCWKILYQLLTFCLDTNNSSKCSTNLDELFLDGITESLSLREITLTFEISDLGCVLFDLSLKVRSLGFVLKISEPYFMPDGFSCLNQFEVLGAVLHQLLPQGYMLRSRAARDAQIHLFDGFFEPSFKLKRITGKGW